MIFYFQVIFPKKIGIKWILGKPFFKKYQISLDIDKKIYGFYIFIKKKVWI